MVKCQPLFRRKISEVKTSFVVQKRRVRAFLVIHLCDKMTDAISRLHDILVVVEMNFFLLESADEFFGITVLPKTPSPGC